MIRIRPAHQHDLPSIVSIYNEAVAEHATADMDPISVADRSEWLAAHPIDLYPVVVAEVGEATVGWASLSAYRPGRRALRHAAEISYFVHSDSRRIGIGRALVEDLLRRCHVIEHRTVFAILIEDNAASIALLRSLGFECWGHLPRIADFDGREVGQVYYGLRIA